MKCYITNLSLKDVFSYDKPPVSYGHPCLPPTLDHRSSDLVNRQDSLQGRILTFEQFQHHELLEAVTCR